ncbi:hypothetical protein [Cronobacter dublinensis]|uniref:hypothetical protein n=1 Tax=Cronobacter dublinensis TaxID=413497 RepID=UPI0005181617|nr:hypothetical protein [Cronobacter dublinensis]ALB65079.1 hypothetical protein AFK67_00630 [Cronobacter dublinensis subsp. dublinensis LMG 23823]ELQ6171870.1 hypothetical protein [Cronobacter dublinensis]MDI7272459.1 hypothetical protein [Cronobacter dublinensis]
MRKELYQSVVNIILQKLSFYDFVFSSYDEVCLIDIGCRSKSDNRTLYFSLLLKSDLVVDDKPDEIVYEIMCIKDNLHCIRISADLTYGDGAYHKKWNEILIDESGNINNVFDDFFSGIESEITMMISSVTKI